MQEDHIDLTKYKIYRQNQIVDNIVKALLGNKTIDSSGNAVIEFLNATGTITLTIEHYSELEGYISKEKYFNGLVNQTVPKLFEALLVKMSVEGFNTSTAVMTINEYAELLDRKDKFSLKKQTNIDLQILKNTIIKFNSKKDYCFYLCDEKTYMEKNKIVFVLSTDLFNIIRKQKNFLYIPVELFQTNERINPYTYLLYKKIIASKRINCGNDKRENKIKVKELYNYCSTLPKYEHISKTGGQVSQRIIKPLERDLNAISILKWNYENIEFKTFEEWLETTIQLEWLEELPGLKSVIDGRSRFNEKRELAKEKALIQVEKSKLKNQTNNEVNTD